MIALTAIQTAELIFTTSITVCLLHALDHPVVFQHFAVLLSTCAFQLAAIVLERELERQRHFCPLSKRCYGNDNQVGLALQDNMTNLGKY